MTLLCLKKEHSSYNLTLCNCVRVHSCTATSYAWPENIVVGCCRSVLVCLHYGTNCPRSVLGQVKALHRQKHHRLDASCGFYWPDASCIKPVDVCEHQTCCNLIFADLLQVNETTCVKRACRLQLAASLLTTCNRLVIIKPEQATRTHPDIGLVIADLLQSVNRVHKCFIAEMST